MSKRGRRRKLTRDQEAADTRREYGSWQDFLQREGCWLQCGRCGKRQFRKGDPIASKCCQCWAKLAEEGV